MMLEQQKSHVLREALKRLAVAICVFGLALDFNTARGDGGRVQLSQSCGNYRLSVFTSPTPLRVGKVDVSAYLQDATTSRPVGDTAIFITATPVGREAPTIRRLATAEQAANKLFRAAEFEIPKPGRWKFSVEATGLSSPLAVAFEADVAEPPPQWLAIAPWIGWPWLVVAVFVAARCSRSRQGKIGKLTREARFSER